HRLGGLGVLGPRRLARLPGRPGGGLLARVPQARDGLPQHAVVPRRAGRPPPDPATAPRRDGPPPARRMAVGRSAEARPPRPDARFAMTPRNLVAASSTVSVARAGALLLQAAHFAVAARLLPPAQFAGFAAALALVTIATALAEFGVTHTT